MRLTAAEVEAAFIETAREQENGEAFKWDRVAQRLNKRLSGPQRQAVGTWTFAR